MGVLNYIHPTTTVLNDKGEGLCGTCKRKFVIYELELCMYCDKWCCSSHRYRSKRISGAWVCDICRKEHGDM